MTLVESILAYSAESGVPVARVSRDSVRPWRMAKGLGWPREMDAMWSSAKEEAAARSPGLFPSVPVGMVPKETVGEINPEVHPLPPGMDLQRVSTLRRTPEGVQWTIATKAKESPEELIARLMESLPTTAPTREELVPPPTHTTDDDLMACVVLGDGHVGLCTWEPETGANWDLRIAEDVHKSAVADLVSRGPAASTGYLVELGDWLDSDGVNATTTAGTPQDSDTRWPLVVETGLRIMVHAVDCMLAKHQRVVVDIIPGNHSRSTATVFQHYVAAWFRNEPRVEVVTSPALRHYHRFGRCLIGTTHGDGPKAKELPEVMAAEVPELWGATRHRRFFIGHVHHSAAIEHRGCTVESFRTLSPRSSWAASRGYVSKRDASRITFHRDFGEVSREVCSVEYLMARKGVAA